MADESVAVSLEERIGAAEHLADFFLRHVATAATYLVAARDEDERRYTPHLQRIGPRPVVLSIHGLDLVPFVS